MSEAMDNDNVVVRIEFMVNQLRNSTDDQSKPTIFEVDDQLRQGNEKDYEPRKLAIGPIHRGKDCVKGMEQQKLRYLQQLLERKHTLSIEKLVAKLREMEERARGCYSNSIHLDKDEFVEMLLLDGCFVIELLRRCWFDDLVDENDHMLQSHQTLCQIRHDLMLFENQLPLFVLNQLFDMTRTGDPEDNICFLVLNFVEDMFFPCLAVSKVDFESKILLNADHLLGLVYKSCFSFCNKNSDFSETEGHEEEENSLVLINSASELKEAGIRLKRSTGVTLLDVTFADGVIRLPPLDVSDETESILRNLIAYELCLPDDHPKYVTDYAFLMQCLTNSAKDVGILRRSGIVRNLLGGDDLICHVFSGVGKYVVRSADGCYSDVFQSVNRHCSRLHKTWMTKLKRWILS